MTRVNVAGCAGLILLGLLALGVVAAVAAGAGVIR